MAFKARSTSLEREEQTKGKTEIGLVG